MDARCGCDNVFSCSINTASLSCVASMEGGLGCSVQHQDIFYTVSQGCRPSEGLVVGW